MSIGAKRLCMWIPLGTAIGLSLGNIELDKDPAPPQKGGGAPNFRPMSIAAKGCMDQGATGTEVGLGLLDTVLDGNPAPPPLKGHSPNFRPMSVVAKRRLRVRWDSTPPEKRHSGPHPIFGPCLLWPNGWMDEDTTW